LPAAPFDGRSARSRHALPKGKNPAVVKNKRSQTLEKVAGCSAFPAQWLVDAFMARIEDRIVASTVSGFFGMDFAAKTIPSWSCLLDAFVS